VAAKSQSSAVHSICKSAIEFFLSYANSVPKSDDYAYRLNFLVLFLTMGTCFFAAAILKARQFEKAFTSEFEIAYLD